MSTNLLAITRSVAPSLDSCELTYLSRTRIDHFVASRQHTDYITTLGALGVKVIDLDPLPDFPDSCFVEDTAIVLDEVAVIMPMGSASRKGEEPGVVETLKRFRDVVVLEAGNMEGGDVLRIGRTLYVGDSTRTNRQAMDELQRVVRRFGYQVESVKVRGCLHLKTGCTAISDEAVLVNPRWIDISQFAGKQLIPVVSGEEWAANALRVGGVVVMSQTSSRTAELVQERGIPVCTIDISELQKAEAGITCLSILFSTS